MKTKILLSLVILFFAVVTVNAQITEGRYFLGGSIGFSTSNSKNSQSADGQGNSLYTNIQLGKVIKDNTVAGVLLSYGYSNNGLSNVISTKVTRYGAGVFYRKYKTIAKDFYFFGEADALYNYSKNRQGILQVGNNGTINTNNAGSLSFTPGLSYFIFRRIQMELLMQNIISISYTTSKNETTYPGSSSIETDKSNAFSANINVNSSLLNNFAIGFKFLLGK
ncbi:MAG TPA: hypothetical protein VN722_13230 [Hanamia sp.]|nr:hypothetical protein [Hanamia sp.]